MQKKVQMAFSIVAGVGLLLFGIAYKFLDRSIPAEAMISFSLQEAPKGLHGATLSAADLLKRKHPSSWDGPLSPMGLMWPLPGYTPGRGYGWRPAARDRTRIIFHNGVDVVAPTWTPVLAATSGMIFRARDMGDCGIGVILLHQQSEYKRVTTSYCHLISLSVGEGDVVHMGQEIGAVGSTGNSTTPHLHLGMHIENKHTDPVPMFANVPNARGDRPPMPSGVVP